MQRHHRKIALYTFTFCAYAVGAILLYDWSVEHMLAGFTLAPLMGFLFVSAYFGLCALSFLATPDCVSGLILAKNRRQAAGYSVGLTICLLPTIGGVFFENKMLAHTAQSAQIKNRINLEALPEVVEARASLQRSKEYYETISSNTQVLDFAKAQLLGVSLTIQKLDTSHVWDKRIRLLEARQNEKRYRGQVDDYQVRLDSASAAVMRANDNLKAVWGKAIKEYGEKSWSEVSGEKVGFDPVKVFSGFLSMAVILGLTCVHVLFTFLYPEKTEKKSEQTVTDAKVPVQESEQVEQKFGAEFLKKYRKEDLFLKCVAKGATSFKQIEAMSASMGERLAEATARMTVYEKSLMNPATILAEYIADWENKTGRKLKDFRNNGAYHG